MVTFIDDNKDGKAEEVKMNQGGQKEIKCSNSFAVDFKRLH